MTDRYKLGFSVGFNQLLNELNESEESKLSSNKAKDADRVYAIGDIHGCLGMLRQIFKMILEDIEEHKPKNPVVVYVGDYVDRGPDSKGVIDAIRNNELGINYITIMGNHEDLMIKAIRTGKDVLWLENGGVQTIASYVDNPQETLKHYEDIRAAYEKVPQEHMDFLERTKVFFQIGHFYFCHAGVYPGIELSKQSPETLMWIRDRFLNSEEDHGAVIVHGHTPKETVEVHDNRIGLDTGACFYEPGSGYGTLTCAVLNRTLKKPERLLQVQRQNKEMTRLIVRYINSFDAKGNELNTMEETEDVEVPATGIFADEKN